MVKYQTKGGPSVMQDNKDFLGTEPVGKLLLKLSIPTVIAQLINMLYNIVDRIYIRSRCLYAPDYDCLCFCCPG